MRLTEKDKSDLQDFVLKKIEEIIITQSDSQSKLISNAVNVAIKPLLDEITILRETLEETRDQYQALQNKLSDKNTQIANLEQTVISSTQRNVALHSLILQKADEGESYSRKDSLRISGIAVDPNEDNDSLRRSVLATLNEHDAQISDNDIYRLHRSSKPQPMNKFKTYLNKVNKTPLPIDPADKTETSEVIVRFARWAPRARVYNIHYKKDIAVKVKCDLTKYRQDVLNNARQYLKDNNLRGYCYNTAECNLCLKNVTTGKKTFFTNFADFKFQAAILIEDPLFHQRTTTNP